MPRYSAAYMWCSHILPHNPHESLATCGGAVLTPRMLSFAPPSPPPLHLDSPGDVQERIILGLERRGGRGRGRGKVAALAHTLSRVSPPPTLEHVDLSTSPLMAPGVSNPLGLAAGSSFRVRIGERLPLLPTPALRLRVSRPLPYFFVKI